MKKLFLLAAVMLTFISCKDDEGISEEPKIDEISVLPELKEFDNSGGTALVVVTSTGEWTLSTKENANYDWVSTDKTKGTDGDAVKFTVKPNETEETRFAYYVFTCGTSSTEFKIASFAGEIQSPLIEIEETEFIKDYKDGTLRVLVKYSDGVNYRDLTVGIPDNITWFKHVATLEGDENGTAYMQFEYEESSEFNSREVSFVINYDKVSIPVKMKQLPKPVIEPSASSYSIGSIAGTLSIKVSANVEYNVDVESVGGGESWLKDYAHSEGIDSWSYDSFEGTREAIIRFTEASPFEGVEPVTAEVKVTQSNSLILTVPRMNSYRAIFSPNAINKNVLNLGKNITIEFLIKPDEYNMFNDPVTILGIHNRFTINLHEASDGALNVICARNENFGNEHYVERVYGYDLAENKWTHIAVTVDSDGDNKIKIYQNGVEKNWAYINSDMKDIDFSETYKANNGLKQEFAIGYGPDERKFVKGQMSEVRIWNRALTPEEINAENHFYSVEPTSEGLVAYWKMNEGDGSIIKDYTSNGNDLVGQKYNGSIWENTDLVWEPVSLPE